MNAIVIGASSGIGLELARLLSASGYGFGLATRRGISLELTSSRRNLNEAQAEV